MGSGVPKPPRFSLIPREFSMDSLPVLFFPPEFFNSRPEKKKEFWGLFVGKDFFFVGKPPLTGKTHSDSQGKKTGIVSQIRVRSHLTELF